MVDLGTGLTVLGSGAVSKETVGKILGPTADYVGGGLAQWTRNRVKNVQRVFAKAEGRLGRDIDKPGTVPPRVLKGILEEGQFAENEVMVEYLGGVLASSRTEGGRDDSAVPLISLIGRLSTYALRTHYCCYAGACPVLAAADVAFKMTPHGPLDLYISAAHYALAMDFSEEELARVEDIVTATMHELVAEGLLAGWVFGDARSLTQDAQLRNVFTEPGLVFTPTQRGVLLFQVAHGVRDDPLGSYPAAQAPRAIEGVHVPEVSLVETMPPVGPGPPANPLVDPAQ